MPVLEIEMFAGSQWKEVRLRNTKLKKKNQGYHVPKECKIGWTPATAKKNGQSRGKGTHNGNGTELKRRHGARLTHRCGQCADLVPVFRCGRDNQGLVWMSIMGIIPKATIEIRYPEVHVSYACHPKPLFIKWLSPSPAITLKSAPARAGLVPCKSISRTRPHPPSNTYILYTIHTNKNSAPTGVIVQHTC